MKSEAAIGIILVIIIIFLISVVFFPGHKPVVVKKSDPSIDSMAVYEAMVKKLVGTNQVYEHGYYRGHQEASDFIQNALNKGHNVIDRNGRSYLDTTYWKLLKTDPFEFPEN